MSDLTDLGKLTAETFRPFVGGTVSVRAEGDDLPDIHMVVETVSELPEATMPNSPRTAFTVVLTAPDDGRLPASLHASVRPPEGEPLGPLALQRTVPREMRDQPTAWFQMCFN